MTINNATPTALQEDEDALPTLVKHPGSGHLSWNKVPLGVGEAGEVVWDVQETPALTTIGHSGAGNTALLRSILLHCTQHSDDWEIWGLDPMRMSLTPYQKRGTMEKLATTFEDGMLLCRDLVAEMGSRYERMTEAGVNSFRDLPEPPKAILLAVIDEAGATLNVPEYSPRLGTYNPDRAASWREEGETKFDTRQSILHLASMGKAAGIYILISTNPYNLFEALHFRFDGQVVLTKEMRPAGAYNLGRFRFGLDADLLASEVKGRAIYTTAAGEMTLFQTYWTDYEKRPTAE